MPAQNLYRTAEKGIYSHIYNKGVENRIIFNDSQDYEVFQGFLKDYLTPPQDPDSLKKDFSVHGRIFRGTPHQPKNYFNKVELIAYSLMPDHFHLLLNQKTKGSLESFIRSLCTRYSMYFNKKYKRSGALFQGPYKSIQIEDRLRLLHLTRYLHHTGGYSSLPEYLDTKESSWVKPEVILSVFGKGTGGYKDFVEKSELDQKEKELTSGITFESETAHLERRGLARDESIQPNSDSKPRSRMPEFLVTSTLVLLLLVTLGIRNITASTMKSPSPTQTSSVLSETAETKGPDPSQLPSVPPETEATEQTSIAPANAVKPKILTVKINDGAESVNIRQKPTTDSEKIGQAKDGDTFEFVSLDSGWYGVKLEGGSTGFIWGIYIEGGENN